ncbi:MAG: hypothetical protein IPL78_21375 [Chloroflexi bacterium]|nr:hypothetical protein [Chloroflexota bacterium]
MNSQQLINQNVRHNRRILHRPQNSTPSTNNGSEDDLDRQQFQGHRTIQAEKFIPEPAYRILEYRGTLPEEVRQCRRVRSPIGAA